MESQFKFHYFPVNTTLQVLDDAGEQYSDHQKLVDTHYSLAERDH